MKRGVDFVILLDVYGELLSKGQREALDMRYNADLSLSEIAEETGGVTRQSAAYSIRTGERRLEELEERLGFAKRLKTLSRELGKAKTLLEEIAPEHSDKRLDELKALLEKMEREI